MPKAKKLVDGVVVPVIEVQEGECPVEVIGRGHLNAAQADLLNKARGLKPGQWFQWPNPPSSWRTFAKKYIAPIEAVRFFRTAGGGVIVAHKSRSLVQRPDSPPAVAVSISPLGKASREVLLKMHACDMPMTRTDLLSATGLSVLPNDEIDKLVADGLIKVDVRAKDARKTMELTAAGKAAALGCLVKK
ncbi:MAG: hypothetical protein WAZ94_13310 [Phycisphaerales bacterium]